MIASERLPEDQDRVEAFDRALDAHAVEAIEHAAQIHARYNADGVPTFRGAGFALRPLFLDGARMQALGASLARRFEALREALSLGLADDVDRLQAQVPLPHRAFEALGVAQCLRDDDFCAISRPDGFLYADRYVVSEPNFGNGYLITAAETELLFDHFAHSPAMRALGWERARLRRPFEALLAHMRRRLGHERAAARERGAPRIALLSHRDEHRELFDEHDPYIGQIGLAERLFAQGGFATCMLHEDELVVDADGHAVSTTDGARVDLVFYLTVGNCFLLDPERLLGTLAHLRSARVGDAPFVQPLATLVVGKGTMPFWQTVPGWPDVLPDGLRVELAATRFPVAADAAELRLARERFVIQRAFDGQRNVLGVLTPGRVWNRIVDEVTGSPEYIVQEYCSLPRAVIPVCIDGRHIERVEVRVELSPFVIDGRYAGSFARYALDREGVVLSPPPPDLGLSMVFDA